MAEDVITVVKRLIQTGTLEHIQDVYSMYMDDDTIAWDYVFLKVYVHACLKKRRDIVEWLITIYDTFDPIQQIALRQTFAYGKYLLNK